MKLAASYPHLRKFKSKCLRIVDLHNIILNYASSHLSEHEWPTLVLVVRLRVGIDSTVGDDDGG